MCYVSERIYDDDNDDDDAKENSIVIEDESSMNDKMAPVDKELSVKFSTSTSPSAKHSSK